MISDGEFSNDVTVLFAIDEMLDCSTDGDIDDDDDDDNAVHLEGSGRFCDRYFCNSNVKSRVILYKSEDPSIKDEDVFELLLSLSLVILASLVLWSKRRIKAGFKGSLFLKPLAIPFPFPSFFPFT